MADSSVSAGGGLTVAPRPIPETVFLNYQEWTTTLSASLSLVSESSAKDAQSLGILSLTLYIVDHDFSNIVMAG